MIATPLLSARMLDIPYSSIKHVDVPLLLEPVLAQRHVWRDKWWLVKIVVVKKKKLSNRKWAFIERAA
jgi:hypothetical protein